MYIIFMRFVLIIISNYVVLKGTSLQESVPEWIYYQFVYLAKFFIGYLLLKCFNTEFCDFEIWFRLSVVGQENVVTGGLNSLFTDIEFNSIIRLDSVITLISKYLNEARTTYLEYWYNNLYCRNTSLLNGSLGLFDFGYSSVEFGSPLCVGLESEKTYTGLCSVRSA